MGQLASPVLQFARDGRHLVVAGERAVTVVDVRSGATTTIPGDGVRSVVAFSDQLWVASRELLTRLTLDGRWIGQNALPPADEVLVAAPVGAPAALWGALALIADEGMQKSSGTAAELAIPLTGRRWVTVQGSRVIAPSGVTCELPPATRVIAGAIAIDAKAVVVQTERELYVIGLANGRVLARQSVGGKLVRIAQRRGLAMWLVEPRRFVVVDLRSGRVLGHGSAPFDITDLAIDPDGARIATRAASGEVEITALDDALRPVADKAVETVEDDEDDEVPSLPTLARPRAASAPLPITDAPARRTLRRPFALRALSPIEHVDPVERAVARDLLDRELRRVALLTLRAIAEAWDTRRLGYGNEGKHPYEHEVAALLGMNRGFAPEYVTAASEHLAAHASCERTRATPIGALAAELGLSELAVDILFVVAAPALRSETARLYGILANDPERALVDEALVEQILAAVDRDALAAELDPRAPLLRLGVLRSDGRTRPFAGLSVDPVVLARLRREAPDLGASIALRSSDRALEELAIAGPVIEDALDALAAATPPARIVVRGRAGSGRRTLLAALATEAGRPVGVIDAASLPRTDTAFVDVLRVLLRRAQLAGLLPCLLALDAVAFADRSGCDVAADVLRAHPGPVAVVLPAGAAAPFDAGHVAIDLAVLAEGARVAQWKTALADAGLEADVDALAARYRIGPGVIHRSVAAALARNATGDATSELEHFIRQTRDATLGTHARRVERLATWDSLVLPPDILDSLRELVARVRHRRTVFETWGMAQTLATSRGLTALFQGQPGTGKTLMAGVIARELGLDLYQVDLSKVMSKWLGETERNLAAIFDAAEDGQVILLFDEADSLFARRTEVRSSNDRYANLEVNYLLQRLDSFEGIAILTTNSGGSIDPAFKRRMSFRLSIPFPDEETREQLWRVHLPPQLPTAGPLAFDKLARKYQLSGGYIRNACLRAAFLAADAASPLDQSHLERAVALEFAELGKLSSAGAID